MSNILASISTGFLSCHVSCQRATRVPILVYTSIKFALVKQQCCLEVIEVVFSLSITRMDGTGNKDIRGTEHVTSSGDKAGQRWSGYEVRKLVERVWGMLLERTRGQLVCEWRMIRHGDSLNGNPNGKHSSLCEFRLLLLRASTYPRTFITGCDINAITIWQVIHHPFRALRICILIIHLVSLGMITFILWQQVNCASSVPQHCGLVWIT